MWFIQESNDGSPTAAVWESDVNCFLTQSYEFPEYSPLFPGTDVNSFQDVHPHVSSRWQEILRQLAGNHGCAEDAYESYGFI